MASGVEDGTIKRDLISEAVVRGQFYSILFYSILFLMNLNPMLTATKILYCTVSKSDQWETEFLGIGLVFLRLSLVRKPVCRPYANSLRFCLVYQPRPYSAFDNGAMNVRFRHPN